ncbi:MAG: SEC-C metal-binding domain-containing protein [Nitrospiraceae bacterium]|nr:SEC-C metal-binding domain-containing protein [Nitrospiraceae bacterium]
MDNTDRDKFIEELDRKIKFYEGLQGDLYKESLKEQFALAKRFYGFLLKPDGSPDSELFEDIAFSMDADLMGWVVEMPFALADHASMVDEAVEIGNLFANVHSPENFYGDMAAILAEAGRREEAFESISKNLEMFPANAWIVIKAGHSYQELQELDKAIELYKRAYDMTSPLSYDRGGVLQFLVPLLREIGMDAEADAMVGIEEKAENAREEKYKRYEEEETTSSPVTKERKPATVKSKKTGRNEPCPCGSSKKYKKCCGK